MDAVTRRTFLRQLSHATAAATTLCAQWVDAAQIPNSTGVERPRTKAPANATDCHVHIYDARFQSAIPPLPHATVTDYRLLQHRNGTARVVIVTPRNYVVDNSV